MEDRYFPSPRGCFKELAPRYWRVTKRVCVGYTYDRVARELSLSKSAVRTYVTTARAEMGFSSTEAMKLAFWDLHGPHALSA